MAKLVLAIDDDKYVHHIIEESLAGFCKIIHAKDYPLTPCKLNGFVWLALG